jgi:DNA-binding PadR family transcriptional regulator
MPRSTVPRRDVETTEPARLMASGRDGHLTQWRDILLRDDGSAMRGHVLNPTAASLLGFLHDGPMTGWDLVAVAQQRIGEFWTLTQSQVYRELRAMAEAGLVEAGAPGPRDRKPYMLTAAGRAAFTEWVNREPGLEQIRFPLLVTITFAGHLPRRRLAQIVARHRAVHAERLVTYERLREALVGQPPGEDFQLATLEFGLRYERAVLAWFDQLPAMLPALSDQRSTRSAPSRAGRRRRTTAES